jgi:glutathione synthase/RimK-type ligase-like ATP-grasp enzyme
MESVRVPIANQCRYALEVARRHGYRCDVLDGGDGYLFRISDGRKSFLAGAGSLSSYPLNNAVAASIARDKIFTNMLLTQAGIPNLGGRHFFLSDEGRKLRSAGHESADARSYAAAIGFPVFCKPLTGSKGDFAEVIPTAEALEDYLRRVSIRHRAIVVQEFFDGDEFRVFVFDKQPLFCIEKGAVRVIGDGERSVRELLDSLNRDLRDKGVSAYPENTPVRRVSGEPVSDHYRPAVDESLEVHGRRNLSVGAGVAVLETIPDDFSVLAVSAAQTLELRVAAVDILRCRETSSAAALRVVEVNANPDISALECLDRRDLIEKIWLSAIEILLK